MQYTRFSHRACASVLYHCNTCRAHLEIATTPRRMVQCFGQAVVPRTFMDLNGLHILKAAQDWSQRLLQAD